MSTLTLKDYILPILLGICALAVSGSAAFYSVTGLSKLFAGASTEILIMAGSLEVSKLVIASFLYRNWTEINSILKYYLTTATVVLVLITSLGIYGFLTSAYQTTSDQLSVIDNQVQVMELRKQRFIDQLSINTAQQLSVNQNITDLSAGLASGTTVQYVDQSGQLITTTSASARRSLESQLNLAISQRDQISTSMISLSDSISSIDQRILEVKQSSEIAGEVGPLRYLSEISDLPMNSIVNIFALIIVFVFDPLAISLVIAANFAFLRLKSTKIVDKLDKSPYFNVNPPTSVVESTIKEEVNQEVPVQKVENTLTEKIKKILQYTPSNINILTDTGIRKKISKEEYRKYQEKENSKRYL